MPHLTPISILVIFGLAFLFLAAFNFNFPHISSGWLGLALIFLAGFLPALSLSANALLLVIVILLLIILIILLSGFLRRRV